MGRRENRRTQRTTATETTEPPEGDDSVFQTGTSLQDLSTTAEPTQFDQTFQVDSSDISVSPDANIPIAKPWEGIPRAAVVFNLNYVYDPDRGEWIRQKKSEGSDSGINVIGGGSSELRGVFFPVSPDKSRAVLNTSAVDNLVVVSGTKAPTST